ncbi:hypothetical protein JXB28_00765 [Candidatus Woesearchaeota archaeon]|nr:hypothetical protein [Candidatus Woesearchaeota archaeon]
MFLELLKGVLSLANAFIAVFIVIYALLFLKQTRSHKERRPWDYLVVASTIYLAYTIMLLVLAIYDVKTFIGLNLEDVSIFFQFIYSGLILLAFISQTDLIFKNEIIIITRKLEPKDKDRVEEEIEKEIGEALNKPKEPAVKPKDEHPEPKAEAMGKKPTLGDAIDELRGEDPGSKEAKKKPARKAKPKKSKL